MPTLLVASAYALPLFFLALSGLMSLLNARDGGRRSGIHIVPSILAAIAFVVTQSLGWLAVMIVVLDLGSLLLVFARRPRQTR